MSGGSLDYVCFKVGEAADQIMGDKRPLYRAFGKHVKLVADALHAVEWEYSSDTCEKDTIPHLEAVLGDTAKQRQLEEILADLRRVADGIAALMR